MQHVVSSRSLHSGFAFLSSESGKIKYQSGTGYNRLPVMSQKEYFGKNPNRCPTGGGLQRHVTTLFLFFLNQGGLYIQIQLLHIFREIPETSFLSHHFTRFFFSVFSLLFFSQQKLRSQVHRIGTGKKLSKISILKFQYSLLPFIFKFTEFSFSKMRGKYEDFDSYKNNLQKCL